MAQTMEIQREAGIHSHTHSLSESCSPCPHLCHLQNHNIVAVSTLTVSHFHCSSLSPVLSLASHTSMFRKKLVFCGSGDMTEVVVKSLDSLWVYMCISCFVLRKFSSLSCWLVWENVYSISPSSDLRILGGWIVK